MTLWFGDRKVIWLVKKAECWYIAGGDLTGALHVLRVLGSGTNCHLPSSLAAAKLKSGSTFCYWFTQLCLQTGC